MYIITQIFDSYLESARSANCYADAIKIMHKMILEETGIDTDIGNLYHSSGFMTDEQIPVCFKVTKLKRDANA